MYLARIPFFICKLSMARSTSVSPSFSFSPTEPTRSFKRPLLIILSTSDRIGSIVGGSANTLRVVAGSLSPAPVATHITTSSFLQSLHQEQNLISTCQQLVSKSMIKIPRIAIEVGALLVRGGEVRRAVVERRNPSSRPRPVVAIRRGRSPRDEYG